MSNLDFDKLIEELKDLPTGNKNSSEYEDLCFNIIDALFGEHFYGWDSKNLDSTKKKFFQLGIPNEEQSNNKPYQKRDLVVPLRESNTLSDFWKFTSRTLNSRYVTFEFKNYTDSIGQEQIITTEKYLYPKALRSIAIIFTRRGIDESGRFAMHGAIREAGKFILILDDDEVIKMLKESKKGSDASDLLFNKIDDLLMKLPR